MTFKIFNVEMKFVAKILQCKLRKYYKQKGEYYLRYVQIIHEKPFSFKIKKNAFSSLMCPGLSEFRNERIFGKYPTISSA